MAQTEAAPPAFLHIEQSLPICIALAALGGMLEVAATACTAIPSVRAAQQQQEKPNNPWWWEYLALFGNISLQLTGSLMSHLVATWFGPVSMVVPFFYSSTLLCNMLIFGALLGLEFFNKTAKTGTLVIVAAVILLPVVGPAVQEGQDIVLLMHRWYATLWFTLLLALMTISGILIFALDITRKFSQRGITLILLSARASSIAINLTVSKGFVSNLPVDSWLFTVFLVLKIVSGGIYTYAIVVQSTAIERQSQFLPLNTSTIITVNALTGIFIWEDYKVMSSWYGYACVFCLLGLGCESLLDTDVNLLVDDNPEFGLHRRASMSVQHFKPGDLRTLRKDADGFNEGDELIPLPEEEEDDDENGMRLDNVDTEEGEVQSQKHPLTRREAWKSVLSTPRIANASFQSSYGSVPTSATKAIKSGSGKVTKTVSKAKSSASKAISSGATNVAKVVGGAAAAAAQVGNKAFKGLTQT